MSLKEWQAMQLRNGMNGGETVSLEGAIMRAIRFLGHSVKREDFLYQVSKDTGICTEDLHKNGGTYINKLIKAGRIANAGMPGYYYVVPAMVSVAQT